jgi:hypothetical protein
MLGGPDVFVIPLEEFKGEVARRIQLLLKPPPPATKASGAQDRLIFVDAEPANFDLAQQLGEVLARQGVSYVLTIPELEPRLAREDLEQNLQVCDGVVLVYGENPIWARNRLFLYRKLQAGRSAPPPAIAVYDAPPAEKVPLNFMSPQIQIINGRMGLDENRVQHFLESLKT